MAIWIIYTGLLIAITNGVLGCFLMLKKSLMLGDAIAHAVLPGIVLAYLYTHSRDSYVMLIGASAFGVLTTLFIEWLKRTNKVQEDASIGIVFTFFFAIGIVLISYFADNIDLDQDCVLYGEITYIPLDTFSIGSFEIPRSTFLLQIINVCVLGIIALFFNIFKLITFDSNYAKTIGVKTNVWNLVLMLMVSVSTVSSFEAVGAILVVSFLVIPPAAAYLIHHNLKPMIYTAIIIGIIASISGYYVSYLFDLATAACMSVMAGIQFVVIYAYTLIKKNAKSVH